METGQISHVFIRYEYNSDFNYFILYGTTLLGCYFIVENTLTNIIVFS